MLSSTLKIWVEKKENFDDGCLILAWANIGSLIEGTMKLFLSVFYKTYKKDADAIRRKCRVQDPDGLQLHSLIQFFNKSIWNDNIRIVVEKTQNRRNAIHAFKNRNIGTYKEFEDSLCNYLLILRYTIYRLPYAGIEFIPQECKMDTSLINSSSSFYRPFQPMVIK